MEDEEIVGRVRQLALATSASHASPESSPVFQRWLRVWEADVGDASAMRMRCRRRLRRRRERRERRERLAGVSESNDGH